MKMRCPLDKFSNWLRNPIRDIRRTNRLIFDTCLIVNILRVTLIFNAALRD